MRSKLNLTGLALGGVCVFLIVAASSASATVYGGKPSCHGGRLMCVEVSDPHSAFGRAYVGHDEPANLFYSDVPGSGNSMRYALTLPTDPPPTPITGRSYNFMLHPAFWFGMAMCDTQSYPEQSKTCRPNSDTNIAPLEKHAGTAFQELQFYPPGWVQQFNGSSCDAHLWCAALNIDSLSQDPINGANLNTGCQNKILGGIEYINFAYLTHNGVPQGPPDPLNFDPVESGMPDPSKAFFMHSGDKLLVTLHDTAHGLLTTVQDLTTHESGSMTASAANGFAQIKFAPHSEDCTALPYDFHPMYSTSSPQTRVPWAAHSYNVAFSDEIGHFDWCSNVDVASFSCTGLEGEPGIDQEPADADDQACFPDSAALLVKVGGCENTNAPGFDGASYLPLWPDANTNLHPTPILFSSPQAGPGFNVGYSQSAFETDTPRIEGDDLGGTCDRFTGVGCTLLPPTDDGVPVTFYPFYSMTDSSSGTGCQWLIGNDVPGLTVNDFGKTNQYGTLLGQSYLIFGGHGATRTRFNDFRNILNSNPCT